MRAVRFVTLFLGALLFLAPRAQAVLGVIDNVPAATILIPYFEVDVSDAACASPTAGVTTLFSVTNTIADSTMAHVTVWTDWNVSFVGFSIFLTGFDVQTINLRDILCNGRLPQTGLGSGNSPVGSFSTGLPTFDETCNQTSTPGLNPFYEAIGDFFVEQIKTAFTGRPITGYGICASSGQRGPDIAVGYITIDVTQRCPFLLNSPTSPGYFIATATEANILLGDFFLADPANNFSQGFQAIHLEAGFPGPHTFYGQYTIPEQGVPVDRREPLPSVFSARFARGGGFNETRHLIWRETGGERLAVECGMRPTSFPLDFSSLPAAVFDEQEGVVLPSTIELPNAVNALSVGNVTGSDIVPKLDVAGLPFGWVIYNLQSDATQAVYNDNLAQGYVLSTFQALGLFSVGLHGSILDDSAGNGVRSQSE